MESLLLFLLLSVLTVGAINGFITMIKCSGWKNTLIVTALLWALLMFDLSIDAGLPGLFAASLLIGAIAGFLLLIKNRGLAITLVVTALVFICCMVTITVIASSLVFSHLNLPETIPSDLSIRQDHMLVRDIL